MILTNYGRLRFTSFSGHQAWVRRRRRSSFSCCVWAFLDNQDLWYPPEIQPEGEPERGGGRGDKKKENFSLLIINNYFS